jgi:hypothetical protein
VQFIQRAVENNVHVAIVTFSPQSGLIRSCLEHTYPPDVASKIIVRGNDKTWNHSGWSTMNACFLVYQHLWLTNVFGLLDSCEQGKQLHLSEAAEQLSKDGKGKVTRNNTLLIDDDTNNIAKALKGEVRAIWFDYKNPDSLIQELLDLIAAEDSVGGVGGSSHSNLLMSPMKV